MNKLILFKIKFLYIYKSLKKFNLKCQLIKQAMELKGKNRKSKLMELVKIVKNQDEKMTHTDLNMVFDENSH